MSEPRHHFQWARSGAEWREAAEFFARIISIDPAYISHGEIQTGLSLDGTTWAPDLANRFLNELGAFDDSRSVLIGRDTAGKIFAAANVTWSHETADAPFATLQDMAVDPEVRSTGFGARMMSVIETEARNRGMRWLFLESGKDNRRGHEFFRRHGMREVSHVFAKPL